MLFRKHNSILLCTLLLMLPRLHPAGAQLIACESFAGPAGPLDGSDGGIGWVSTWQDRGSSIATLIEAGGLTHSGLASLPGGAVSEPGYPPESAALTRSFEYAAPRDGRVFVSFLYRPEDGYGTFGGLRLGPDAHSILVGTPRDEFRYGMKMDAGAGASSNVDVEVGVAVFLVVEIRAIEAPARTVHRLFVNATPGAPQPAQADAELIIPGMCALPSNIELANDGGVTTDEIRIGYTWRDVTPTPALLGDMDCDGALTNFDIDPFTLSLTAPAEYEIAFPHCNREHADLNGDGAVDNFDIDPFVALLMND
ncbi:MAG: hypothetical protein JNG88_01035 [Phycisphaerales bacterium]|nr:hypothetical protein [Phycisphaerales bacterium]